MTVASITTDIYIGPFIIPSNGQNMIMNNYAQRNKLRIEIVIPEPIMSNQLATTQWLNKDYNFTNIILTSIHQLPSEKENINKINRNLKNVKFHFALEGINGSGQRFLKLCTNEAKIFNNVDNLDSKKKNWIELHKLLKKI
mgnify:CR=1 FL=1